MHRRIFAVPTAMLAAALVALCAPSGFTQPPDKDKKKGDFPGGKGFGGPGGQERKIVKDFDKNKDGWLNAEERTPARDAVKRGGGPGGFGGPKGGFGKGGEGGKPGPKMTTADVKNYPDAKLYDGAVLRTIFLEFENADWELEMQDFHGTDVDVPATVTVDGKKYANVGVHFRGMSSYMGVGAGSKRSLNLSFDMADGKQRLYGYKTLNLLNGHDDPSLMNAVLFSHIANQYIPAPKANFVKVVINGEYWGVYTNLQQFDKVFLNEHYKTTKGTRWKVRGSPGGRGGLEYFGENVADYKRVFTIKSEDNEAAWKALINLCKVLNQTPADKLEAALKPILDIDGVLWFLALDNALINNDGYWTRASDYTLYLDEKGKFHVSPADMNESFRPGMSFGMGGPGGMMLRLPSPGVVIPEPVQTALQLTDAQKKELAAIQKEVDEKVEKMMTEEQRKQWKEMKDRGAGAGGPGAIVFGPPGGPGGFGPPGGPGGPGGGRGVELDPLVGLTDANKPLRSKLLAVPALKAKYLANVKKIAEDSLDWKKLGPVVSQYRKLIEKDLEIDTRKLDSFDAFKRTTDDVAPAAGGMGPGGPGGFGRGPGGGMNLRAFAEQRRTYLLSNADVKKAGP